MTEQPKELFSVTLKTEKEIEHDKELQRAYQRGYEDGARSRPALPADALDHSPCAVENCSVRYRAGGSQSNGEWVCSEADHTPIKKLKVCPAWLKAHAAAIRNETLDELIPWLERKRKYYGCCSGVDANDDPEDCDPYDTVLKKVKSLRREGAQ